MSNSDVNPNLGNSVQPADFGMTDLEEKLSGTDAATHRETILNSLNQLNEKISVQLGSGLAPQDYDRARRVSAAVASAREVVLFFGKK